MHGLRVFVHPSQGKKREKKNEIPSLGRHPAPVCLSLHANSIKRVLVMLFRTFWIYIFFFPRCLFHSSFALSWAYRDIYIRKITAVDIAGYSEKRHFIEISENGLSSKAIWGNCGICEIIVLFISLSCCLFKVIFFLLILGAFDLRLTE